MIILSNQVSKKQDLRKDTAENFERTVLCNRNRIIFFIERYEVGSESVILKFLHICISIKIEDTYFAIIKAGCLFNPDEVLIMVFRLHTVTIYIYPERPSMRDGIIEDILNCLQAHPADFNNLLERMNDKGYEIKRGKHTAICGKEQKRFIRFRSLGEEFSEENLKKVIAGEMAPPVKNEKPNMSEQAKTAKRKFDLVVDIQEKMAANKVIKTHIINYSKTRDTYIAYRKSGYSKKFYETHRDEIILHKAAKEAFSKLPDEKIPKVKDLNEEFARLLSEKKIAYSEYKKLKKEMRDYQIAKQNVESFYAAQQSWNQEADLKKKRQQQR